MENTLIWLQEMEDNNESWVNISSVITMLKKEQEDAINYSQCCKSDSEQLKAFLDYCDAAGWIKNIDKYRIIKDYNKSH